MNSQKKCGDTESSYAEFKKLKQLPDTYIRQFTIAISEKADPNNYLEITSSRVPWDTEGLQATVDMVRDSAFAGKEVEVEFEYKTILFITGAAFKEWIEQNKLDARELERKGTIKQ
jgi:hypothetical protein